MSVNSYIQAYPDKLRNNSLCRAQNDTELRNLKNFLILNVKL